MDDRDLRDGLGHQALARARQYTPERMVRDYLDAYRGLLTSAA